MEGVLSTTRSGDLPVFVGVEHKKSCQTREMFARVFQIAMTIFLTVLMALVVILFFRVKNLEDLNRLHMETVPSNYADQLDDSVFNMNKTSMNSHPHHSIWRRDTQQDEAISPFYHQTAASAGTSTSFDNFVHVTGSKLMHYEKGQYISWFSEEDENNSLSRQNMPFKQDKFIIIPKPGFYYVYTQLTYADIVDPAQGVFRVGHEVVRKANCGQGESEALLSTWMTQTQNRSATDSTYMGGVFYLYTNDKIGVQIKQDGASQAKIAGKPRPLNFFGAFTVFADPSFDHLLDDSCCCLHV